MPNKTTLQFIHTPDSAIEEKALKPTLLISEKNTQSQNPFTKEKIPIHDPYQQGKTERVSLHQSTQQSHPSIANPTKPSSIIKENVSTDPGPKDITYEPQAPTPERSNNLQDLISNAELNSIASKNIETASDIIAEYRYNTNSHVVARYLSSELKKISNVWQLSFLTETVLPFNLEKTVIAFKIMPDGNYKELQVLNHIGSAISQYYTVNAVRKVSPFSPLPNEVMSYIRDDGLWIVINFNYKD